MKPLLVCFCAEEFVAVPVGWPLAHALGGLPYNIKFAISTSETSVLAYAGGKAHMPFASLNTVRGTFDGTNLNMLCPTCCATQSIRSCDILESDLSAYAESAFVLT
eukprot:1530397-Ditylum_brightwellii.AAC.2